MIRLPWTVHRKAWEVAAAISDPTDPFDDTGLVKAIETALDAYLAAQGVKGDPASPAKLSQ